jgi:predicted alpha-1,6-mannanase (GH76 family)
MIDAGPFVNALQQWYNGDSYSSTTGLYHWDDRSAAANEIHVSGFIMDVLDKIGKLNDVEDTLRWWNSANAITALIDYMLITKNKPPDFLSAVDETFSKGPNAYVVDFSKIVDAAEKAAAVGGLWGPGAALLAAAAAAAAAYPGAKVPLTNFMNNSTGGTAPGLYDDEAWWALAWIKAFDLTRNQKYLDMAVTIGQDMTNGWDNTFNGGIYWRKDHNGGPGSPYKNAIANALFMAVAARLYLRTKDGTWKDWAQKEFNWFINSGLIWGTGANQDLNAQPQYLVNDALEPSGPNAGKNVGPAATDGTGTVWTYNQGVILGALCDLSIIFGDQLSTDPMPLAENIADAAIRHFSNTNGPNGILTEPAASPPPSVDNCQFKGIFIRNLAVLYAHDHKADYSMFISNNGSSLANNNHNPSFQFGFDWSTNQPDKVDFIRQTAGIDAVNAANRATLAALPISLKDTLKRAGLTPPTGIRQAITWLTPSVRNWALSWTT